MFNLKNLVIATICLLAIPAVLPAQWVINGWMPAGTVPIDYPPSPFFAASYQGHLFVMDGVTAWVGEVDPSTGNILSWEETTAPDRTQYRAALVPTSAAVVGDYIVIPHEPESLVARFNSDGSIDGDWLPAPGLVNARATTGVGATAVSGSFLYVVGGHGPGSALGRVEGTLVNQDGTLAPWQDLGSLPAPVILHDPRADVIDGFLYVFGGEGTSPSGSLTHSRNVHRAQIQPDGTLGSWVKVGDMLQARPHAGHLLANGSVHVVAGGVHSYMTSSVESATLAEFGETGSHIQNAPLPYSPGLNELATAVVGSWGYVVGGNTRPFGGGLVADVLVAQLAPLCSADGGPFHFVRRRGKPRTESASWVGCGGSGTLRILNSGTSSAVVVLNGGEVAGPQDFNPNVQVLEIPILDLPTENTLEVTMRGAPGSSLQISFIAAGS